MLCSAWRNRPTMHCLRISLLGEPRLAGPSGVALATPGPKAMALLARVAVAPDLRVDRAVLVELIWADAATTSSARHALRQCLVRLKTCLGPAAVALGADDVAVWLEPDLVALDLALVIAAERGGTDDEIVAASAAVRGRFCAGLETGVENVEAWLRARRGEFDRSSAAVQGAAATILAGRSQADEAIATARRRLELDPFDDAGHAALIELCAGFGRRKEAMDAHAACHHLFSDELGVEPGPEVDAALAIAADRRCVRAAWPIAVEQSAPGAMSATTHSISWPSFAAAFGIAFVLFNAVAPWQTGPAAIRPNEATLWVGPAYGGAAVSRHSAADAGERELPTPSEMLDVELVSGLLYPVGC